MLTSATLLSDPSERRLLISTASRFKMAHFAAQVLIEQTNLRGGFFAAIVAVDLNIVGYVVVSVFVVI
jgi:high-affinity nickel permease